MTDDRRDKVTGRIILKDSSYLLEGTWVIQKCSDDEASQISVCRKERSHNPHCIIDGDHEPEVLGEYEGRFIDAIRKKYELLGWGEFSPSEQEFEDHYQD